MNTAELKAALARMLTLRFCPPDDRLTEGHIRRCPFCQEWATIGLPGTAEAERRTEHPATGIGTPSEIKPGQLWQTDSSLTGYDDEESRHYNPMLVLVVEKIDDSGMVRVAPVHFEKALAYTGDVEIDRGLFAEMWNTFPFPEEYLARYEGTFSVPRVHEQTADPPTPVHRYFRQIEVEAVAWLIGRWMDRKGWSLEIQ